MIWYLLMYIANFFIVSSDQPTSSRAAASLSSHTGFSYALDTFLTVDIEGFGLNFDNSTLLIKKYSIAIYMGMTVANILIFLIFGLYLD